MYAIAVPIKWKSTLTANTFKGVVFMTTKQQALQRLMADIQLKGLSRSTLKVYTKQVERFLEQSRKPIEELSEIDIRNFIGRMIVEKRHTPVIINSYSAAIRYFFAVTLNQTKGLFRGLRIILYSVIEIRDKLFYRVEKTT